MEYRKIHIIRSNIEVASVFVSILSAVATTITIFLVSIAACAMLGSEAQALIFGDFDGKIVISPNLLFFAVFTLFNISLVIIFVADYCYGE